MTNLKIKVKSQDEVAWKPIIIGDISIFSSTEDNVNPHELFKLKIEDKEIKLEDVNEIRFIFPDEELLFVGYKFYFGDKVCILQTSSGEFILLKEYKKYGQFELFSIDGTFLFNKVYYLEMGHTSSEYHQLAIDYSPTRDNRQNRTRLFSFRNFLGSVSIKENTPTIDVEIVDIFGPFPILLNRESSFIPNKPWWVALCDDFCYRVFYYHFKGEIRWIIDRESNYPMVFKRFLPTFIPNTFYFLTKDGREFLVHGKNGESQASFYKELSLNRGFILKRRIQPAPETERSFFLGISHDFSGEKESFPFSFQNFNRKEEMNVF